jgi:ABC-2 type transport system permease protein
MSALAVARNDMRTSVATRGIWLYLAFFVLIFGGVALVVAQFSAAPSSVYLDGLTALVLLLVPLVGVIVGYETIIGERESGSIALLLSMPHSRGEMVVGKLLGRTVVFGGLYLGGAFSGAVVSLLLFPTFDLGGYLALVILGVGYGLAFLTIATGLSMSLSSSRRVTAAAFGVYIGFVVLWNSLVDVAVLVLFRFRPDGMLDPPLWAESAKFVNPRTLFLYLLDESAGLGDGTGGLTVDAQWFASPAVALLVLLAWFVVPPALGYLQFRRAEL